MGRLEGKKAIASVYQTGAFQRLLREVLHPGGLKLTRRLAEIAGVTKGWRVLDIACAKGFTARVLSEEYGCSVVGCDLSEDMIRQARAKAIPLKGVPSHFIVADAEDIPIVEKAFDCAISECSFSILPNKPKAAREAFRVLKSGGRLVMADVYLKKGPEDILESPPRVSFPYMPCLNGALSIEGYAAVLSDAGFDEVYVEDHTWALKGIAFQVGARFGGWEAFFKMLVSELGGFEEESQMRIDDGEGTFSKRTVGYTLLSFEKP